MYAKLNTYPSIRRGGLTALLPYNDRLARYSIITRVEESITITTHNEFYRKRTMSSDNRAS